MTAAPPIRPSAITAYLTNRGRKPNDEAERMRAAVELAALEDARLVAISQLSHITKSSLWRREGLAMHNDVMPNKAKST